MRNRTTSLTLALLLGAGYLALSDGQLQAEDRKVVRVVGGRYPTSTYSRKHHFPGVGDYKKWEEADKLYVEAGKLDDFGKVKQARDKYAEAIGIYPYDMNFFNNYGLVLLKLHDDVGAETAWRFALSQKKDFWEAQNNLGRLLFYQARLPEAKYMWIKASENKPPREVLEAITVNIGLCDRKMRALRKGGSDSDENTSAENSDSSSGTAGNTNSQNTGADNGYNSGGGGYPDNSGNYNNQDPNYNNQNQNYSNQDPNYGSQNNNNYTNY